MATSGTATFNPTILTLIEEAYERAGTEMRSGNDVRSARRTIDIMMSEWANRGINLWTLESAAINLVAGTATYSLPATTVDILDFVIRQGSGTAQIDYQIERMGGGRVLGHHHQEHPEPPSSGLRAAWPDPADHPLAGP